MHSTPFDASTKPANAGLISLNRESEKQRLAKPRATGESLRFKAADECVRWRSVFDTPLDDKNE